MLRRRPRPEPAERDIRSPIPPLIPDIVDVERLTRDPLTGTVAPWLLGDRLEHAVRRLGRTGRLGALLVIDVDQLDVVNDALGLAAGDDLLRQFATRVGTVVQESDTLARLGGDEFGVLVDELAGPDHAGRLAEAVLGSLREAFDLGLGTAMASASVGVVRIDGTEPVTELWRRAELALARAKRRGGACYAAYDERTTHAVEPLLELEWTLRRRLDEGRLRFWYRPVLELRTGSLAFVVSTLPPQWHEVGTIDPADVRRAAEAAGLTDALLRVELTAAAQRSAAWPGHLPVAVDVSGTALAGGRVDGAVAAALANAGVPPTAVLVSVGADASDTGTTAIDQLEALRAAGVRIGLQISGDLALDALRAVPATVLFLDGALLDDLRTDRTRAVAGAVLGIAEVLDAVVVAAGIDDEDRLGAARSLGVDLVLGDRVGPPVEADELEPWFSGSASRG